VGRNGGGAQYQRHSVPDQTETGKMAEGSDLIPQPFYFSEPVRQLMEEVKNSKVLPVGHVAFDGREH
jgi:hypothetical protein